MNTVFIVDDNKDFRSSVAWMLKGEGHQTIEFDSARKALKALKAADTDELDNCCMLLDVRMPGITGPELHDLMRRHSIDLPIVYMTGHGDIAMAVEAMSKGAVNFLEKPLDETKLLNALETAFSVKKSAAKENQTTTASEALNRLKDQLTRRELEVLNGIIDGQANKMIAYNLGISVRTVEVHRAGLMKKIGARNAGELIKKVLNCQQLQQ